MQAGLTDLLREEYSIVPEGYVGHSAGEIACAYADRGLTLEQASHAFCKPEFASWKNRVASGTQPNACLPEKQLVSVLLALLLSSCSTDTVRLLG